MRNFEFGTKVRAFTKLGLQKDSRWTDGIYLGNNSVEFRTGDVKSFEDNHIKRLVRLEYKNNEWPVLNIFVDKTWEELKSTIKDAMSRFYPNTKYSFDDKEHLVYCDSFSIGPAVIEKETWDSFTETPMWQLSVEVGYSGGLWEPPGSDINDIDSSHDVIYITRKLIDNLWNVEADGYWENISYDKMAAEFQV